MTLNSIPNLCACDGVYDSTYMAYKSIFYTMPVWRRVWLDILYILYDSMHVWWHVWFDTYVVWLYYSILAFPADIGKKPASLARAPWEPATMRTRRLMKRPMAKHGAPVWSVTVWSQWISNAMIWWSVYGAWQTKDNQSQWYLYL